jgi:transglutaminase-like putative cysteine protease
MRLTASAMVANLATAAILLPVVQGDRWFWRSAGGIVLVAVLGAGTRALAAPKAVTMLAQALGGLLYFTALYGSDHALAGFVPHRKDAWDQMYDVLAAGFGEIGGLSPPIPARPGVEFIIVGGVGIMALLVDLLSASMRQTALAGLPLLVLYTIPAAVLPAGLSPWYFLLPAAGYLLMLLVESRDRTLRWGIPLAARTAGPTGGRPASDLNRMSRRIGVSTLALAVLIPVVLPLGEGAFGGGGMAGDGSGKTISTLNPLVSLRRELVRPDEFEVMRVTTDATMPAEMYWRTVTLDEFTGDEWKAGRRQVQKFGAVLPSPPGQSLSIGRTRVTSTVTISDRFASDYLPLPYPATRVDVEGAWRVDARTNNVVSQKGRGQLTSTTYTVASNELIPLKADVIGDAPTSPALQPYLQLPGDLPVLVSRLATRITADAEGVLEQGQALQRWFRNPRNFTYDLSVRPGTGKSSIVDFIRGRRGYCEHFASTMAVMARALGIPARVNVGFTGGRLSQDGRTRVITSHDAHAWPELYLPGVGWTRFEPTPGSASSNPNVPSWLAEDDRDPAPDLPDEEPETTPSEAPASGGGPTTKPDCAGADAASAACTDPDVPAQPAAAPAGSGQPWRWGLLLLLLIPVLAGVPAVARLVIRRQRWRFAGATDAARAAETAWRELRDSTVDLGYAWPDARTPRQTGAALVVEGKLDPGAAAALATVTGTVERARYAPSGDREAELSDLRSAVDDVRRALAGHAQTSDRVRARLAPRSLRSGVAGIRRRCRAAVRPLGDAFRGTAAKIRGSIPRRTG